MLPRLSRDPVTRLAWALLLVAVAVRLYGLDRLPGINGDETWLAVQVQHLLRGEAFALRTPTRMFINPLLVASEAALLTVLPPSGWTLRLPVALWGLAGLALLGWRSWRLWRDRTQALLATTLLACAPLAVAYGHCAWDPSFLFVVAPLVVLPALRLADARANRVDIALLLFGVVACLWVHLTAALLLAVLALGIWRLRNPSPWLMVGLAPLALGLALGLAQITGHGAQSWWLLADRDLRFLTQPQGALHLFALPGLLVTGGRAFSFFVGMPETPLVWLVAASATCGLFALAWRLRRSDLPSDRLLAWSWLFLPLPWWLASGLLMPQAPGRERYVVWVLIPAVLLLVRGLREAPRLVLAVGATSAVLSVAWLAAVDRQPWPTTTHVAFRTGVQEPKVAVAGQIRARAKPGEPLRVAVADWWLEHPLRYLLPADSQIGIGLSHPQFRVVWANEAPSSAIETLYDRDGRAILSLVAP